MSCSILSLSTILLQMRNTLQTSMSVSSSLQLSMPSHFAGSPRRHCHPLLRCASLESLLHVCVTWHFMCVLCSGLPHLKIQKALPAKKLQSCKRYKRSCVNKLRFILFSYKLALCSESRQSQVLKISIPKRLWLLDSDNGYVAAFSEPCVYLKRVNVLCGSARLLVFTTPVRCRHSSPRHRHN